MGLYTTRLAKALLETQGMEHIYSFVIGDRVPHLHLHLIGRYPEAPQPYWGARVDEWPGAPRGGAQAIQQVTDRLRAYLKEHYL